MNRTLYIVSCIAVMAITTYLIRVIPLLVFRKKIKSQFVRSFLFYVPYSVLSAMTFPAILSCTGNVWSSAAGTITALFLGFQKKSLVLTACAAAAVSFVVQMIVTGI